MTDPRDLPRVTINWAYFKPRGWRGWLSAAGVLAVAVAVLLPLSYTFFKRAESWFADVI